MEVKKYRKENDYSYAFGAFPTIELLNYQPDKVIKIIIHSSFHNNDVMRVIKSKVDSSKIVVNDSIIEKLASKENIFVIGVFSKYISTISSNCSHLLLDQPSNMGNFGTILRTSLGFNIKDIAVIKPAIDIYDPKVIRSSMGAIFHLNIEYFNSYDEYVQRFMNHTKYSFMLQAKQILQETTFTSELATLIFGNEATGLSERFLTNNSIKIEHSHEIDSLNLPMAVGIALFEYQKQLNYRKKDSYGN